jgi:carbamoylphosphate synthase large subunit
VTGVGGPAGGSLARQLVARGYEVVGVDIEPTTVAGARCERVPAASDRHFVAALRRAADEAGSELIIPTVTEELVVLAGSSSHLWEVPVVVASEAAAALANDKWLTCRRLADQGLPIPSFALASEIGCCDQLTRGIGLPCLTKPRVSRGGRGVIVHEVLDVDAFAAFGEETIVQEFVPGTEYAPNLFLAADERDDVVVVLEKTALAHGKVGNALGVRRTVADDVGALARNAARALGLTGPVDVDIRRRADGVPVVLEVNARFGANSAHAPEVLDALLDEWMTIARRAA